MDFIGENVDRLITVDMRPRSLPLRGYVRQLHEHACKKLGTNSLTLLAARKIAEHVRAGDNVFILTGLASLPHFQHGETDGPLGAACLARALSLGCDAKPIFVLAERDVDSVVYTAKAAGINIEEYETVRETRHCGAVVTFPSDLVSPGDLAIELFDRFQPKAVFSIETPGPNNKEVLHTALGFQHPPSLARLYQVFDEATRRGILTIAGLDVGNEIGGGNLEEEVRRLIPTGDVCKCPCGAGIASRVTADVAIPVTTSNWAAYGVAAMLSIIKEDQGLLQDVETERRMLEACCMAGAIDGVSFRPVPIVDGMSAEANQCVVRLLHEIIANGLTRKELRRPI